MPHAEVDPKYSRRKKIFSFWPELHKVGIYFGVASTTAEISHYDVNITSDHVITMYSYVIMSLNFGIFVSTISRMIFNAVVEKFIRVFPIKCDILCNPVHLLC